MANAQSNTVRRLTGLAVLAFVAVSAVALLAQQTSSAARQTAKPAPQVATATADRWLHVSVINRDPKGERVRVNLPISVAEGVLGSVKHDRIDHGIIKIEQLKMDEVDFRKVYASLKSGKDGEYVTVESASNNVRVAKDNGFFIVRASDKNKKESNIYVRVPLEVVDALFSGKPDELNLLAALRVLSSYGDSELVSVKDTEKTVRVWVDAKNTME
jgi:hypothetical protein